MNLHAIPTPLRPGLRNLTIDTYEELFPDGAIGTIHRIWVENSCPLAEWYYAPTDEAFIIFLYEYDYPYSVREIRETGNIENIVGGRWYIDAGHSH